MVRCWLPFHNQLALALGTLLDSQEYQASLPSSIAWLVGVVNNESFRCHGEEFLMTDEKKSNEPHDLVKQHAEAVARMLSREVKLLKAAQESNREREKSQDADRSSANSRSKSAN